MLGLVQVLGIVVCGSPALATFAWSCLGHIVNEFTEVSSMITVQVGTCKLLTDKDSRGEI